MVDLQATKDRPREQFWEVVEDVHAGMLGLENASQHMQPMAPYADPARNAIWFFVKRDSDLFKSLKEHSRARFCVVGPNHDYHACISGTLFENQDPAQIDKMWNQVVDAWFDEGKDDPQLALLEMKLQDAAIWASVGNPIVFGWEIAKAHVKDHEPDVGVRAHLLFE